MSVAERLHWTTDQDRICRAIEARPATLKIILKTRNEKFFLERWIAHHARIVSPEDIIIFDNESDDPEVLHLMDGLTGFNFFQFGGFHNNIHREAIFAGFYRALRNSCEYFIFLDTDEFLVWVDAAGELVPAEGIVPALRALPPVDVVLGSWIENVLGREDRFRLFQKGRGYPVGLTGGKSILATRSAFRGLVCHNFQMEGVQVTQQNPAHALILHMKNLNPQQRIKVNLQKLTKYNFNNGDVSLQHVLGLDWQSMKPGNPRQWVREIHELSGRDETLTPASEALRPGQIAFDPKGSLTFYSREDRASYLTFLGRAGECFQDALSQRTKAREAEGLNDAANG